MNTTCVPMCLCQKAPHFNLVQAWTARLAHAQLAYPSLISP